MPSKISNVDQLQFLIRRAKQNLCTNAIVEMAVSNVKVTGCKNERRNGSKFCQKCSDKHAQSKR